MTRPSLIRLAAATGMACLFTLPIWAVAAPLAGRPADATDRRAAASPPRAAQLPQPDAGNAEVTILGAIAPATLDVDLRDLPIAAPAADTRPEREAPAPAEPRGPALSMAEMPSATDAAAVQRSQDGPDMPSPSVNFMGMTNPDLYVPPDTNGDVGRSHYLQIVNSSFAVYTKSGVRLAGPTNLGVFFGPLGAPCNSDDGDPIALYDPMADRWLISQFAITEPGSYYECIGISKTSDPVGGGWWLYAVPASTAAIDGDDTAVNDYPKLSVWPDGYYMTANMFPDNPLLPTFVRVWALERDKMLAGQPARVLFADTSSAYFSLLPSNVRGDSPPPGTPAYFLSAGLPNQLYAWTFDVDWANPAASAFSGPVALSVPSFARACLGTRACVPQLGTSQRVDALSPRLMYPLQYRRIGSTQSLWANHTITESGRTVIRWYEVRLDAGGSPSLYQSGTLAPADGVWRWMGSLAADRSGNLAVGYSASGSALSPAIRYSGRLVTDPLGLLPQAESVLQAGGGAQTTPAARWGDYSAMSIDPVDDCTFWYTNEYYSVTSSSLWTTRIGAFAYPSCTPLPAVGFITGTVYNSVTLAPIANLPIAALNLPMTRTYAGASGSGGVFTLTVLPGVYTVTAGTLPAYPIPQSVTVTVTSGVTASVRIGLGGAPLLAAAGSTLTDPLPTGNANGFAEPGESYIQLFQGIANGGSLTATGVSAQLVALTPGVAVVTPTAPYADIPISAVVTNATPFGFSLDGGLLCGTPLNFRSIVTTNQGVFSTTFVIRSSIAGGGPPVTYTSADVPKAIPDNDLATGARSVLFVPDAVAVADVDARLTITHTYDADLNIYLSGPSGTRIALSTGNGGSGDNYSNTTFDDEALIPITSGMAPFAGTYRPEQPLSTFDGSVAQGEWLLTVYDSFAFDTGTLANWSITVRPERCDFPVPNLFVTNTLATDVGGNTNGNGYIDPGENSIYLQVALANRGPVAATTISATLTPQTAGVTVYTATSPYPNIAAGGAQTNTVPFRFGVSPALACGVPLDFGLTATTDQGTYARSFRVPTGIPSVATTVISDDVESGPAGWLTGGTSDWAITNEASRSPTHSWTDSPIVNYTNDASAWLQSPPLDLGAFDTVTMTFWHIYSFEQDFDYGLVEYSIDNGATWGSPLATFTGQQPAWTQVTLPLGSLAHQPSARIRFRLFSDTDITDDGWHVDDIAIFGDRRACQPARAPILQLTPAALTQTLPPDGSITRSLVVSNAGSLTLTWSLTEDPEVAWLSPSITGGTLGPTSSAQVAVAFLAPSATGLYTTWLRIASDDPINPSRAVPVALTVARQVFLPLVLKNTP